MSSPQEPSSGWAAPGGPDEQRPAGVPAQPDGWGAPPAPPSWTQPGADPGAAPGGDPGTRPGGWGSPEVPPPWTGQPPTTPAAPAGYGPAGYGAGPGYGPGYGGPAGYGASPYPAAPAAWAPPALQPGIVPLRPLSLGEILDGGVRAIRANPAVMFGLSAVAVTIAVLISAVLTYYLSGVLSAPLDDVTSTLSPDLSPTEAGDITGQLSYGVGSLFTGPITALVTTILTGLLVVSVSRSVLGRTISVREVLRSGRVWWVVGFSLLSGLAVVVAGALYAGLVLFVGLGLHSNLGAVILGIVGVLGLVVGVFWFATRTRLVTPALMLEGRGFWVTVKRAWRLTYGSFWRLFGIWLLVSVIMYVVEQIVSAPFAIVAVLVGHGELTSASSLAINSVGQVLALTAGTTYTAAVVALLYIDVRMRREGLDIELGRAATADAATAVR